MIVSQLVEEVIAEEVKVNATKELEIGREYIKITVGDSGESIKCDSASKIETLQRELNTYKLTVERLTQLNDYQPFSKKCFVTDEYTKFHTGLPNFKLLKTIFDHVSKGLPTDGVTKLSNFQEFVCLMLKIRINAPNEGLAYQFGVCKATISKIILKWLKLTDIRLSGLIHWLDRDSLQKTMPECFKKSFGAKVQTFSVIEISCILCNNLTSL